MNRIHKTLTPALYLACASCCLQKLEINPTLTARPSSTSVTASSSFTFDCLKGKERAQAIKIKELTAKAFAKLVNGEFSLEEYNAIARSAKKTLDNVMTLDSEGSGFAAEDENAVIVALDNGVANLEKLLKIH